MGIHQINLEGLVDEEKSINQNLAVTNSDHQRSETQNNTVCFPFSGFNLP
jgi:hypothetical protein